MIPRDVADWFSLIVKHDDLTVVRRAVAELDDHDIWPGIRGPRQEHLLNLITAIRLDQMAKENSVS